MRELESGLLETFKSSFDQQKQAEIKLKLVIDFMERSLSQEDRAPYFLSFWETRRWALPLFKENISPLVRAQLWTKFCDLSKEARRLKEMLDEQSLFAVEQIEAAIEALENEVLRSAVVPEICAKLLMSDFPNALKKRFDTYVAHQNQINCLNAQASRISSLRKELLKTEMRIRYKNTFFQRLSAVGDNVFPRRKELLGQISQQFLYDVEAFIKKHFGQQPSSEMFYVLREEIKAFQNLAKELTLSTQSFTQTRASLSECWDAVKVVEKKWKQERAQQRIVSKQNADIVELQFDALKNKWEEGGCTSLEVLKGIEAIVLHMRKVELGREELKYLKEKVRLLRLEIDNKIKHEEIARQQAIDASLELKRQEFQSLKQQIESMLQNHATFHEEALVFECDALLAKVHNSSLSKNDKYELERLFKPFKEILADKREKALLKLPEDESEALLQLKSLLKQCKQRRQEIKSGLEVLRRAAGSSNLDFEKAIHFTHQINEEKERLEKTHVSIREIETKISELQDHMGNDA